MVVQQKISAVIITLNEEKNIERCILSLKDVADEIIVVDSKSQDNTQQLATNSGARVLTREWEGYSAAKNYGNEQASGEWILSIDADEALDSELIQSLVKFKTSEQPPHIAFEFSRLTNYCGQWINYCGWYPDKKIRMWRKAEGTWDGHLHEKVVLSHKSAILKMPGDILHYSFPSIEKHVQTINKYSNIAAQELVDRGKKVSLLHVLLNPAYTFFNKYVLRLGFLDGYYGFVICWLSAQANFLKYAKALSLKRSLRS